MSLRTTSQKNRRLVASVSGTPGSGELSYSILLILILSAIYVAYELLAEPRGGHPFGHSLGIIGTILMVMTEVLYSVRKRTRLFNWAGPVRYWLSLHIFTGIVGPFMVLMHTGLTFRGLAGISMLLTVIVVGSGFVGRYLYTALPHSITGAVASRRQILNEAQEISVRLDQLQADRPEKVRRLVTELGQRRPSRHPLLTVFGRAFFQWRFRRRLQRAIRQLEQLEEEHRRQMEALLSRKRELDRQIEMLETARRMLRYWHILHVPIGLTLFSSVAIHIVATIYFRAGLLQ